MRLASACGGHPHAGIGGAPGSGHRAAAAEGTASSPGRQARAGPDGRAAQPGAGRGGQRVSSDAASTRLVWLDRCEALEGKGRGHGRAAHRMRLKAGG